MSRLISALSLGALVVTVTLCHDQADAQEFLRRLEQRVQGVIDEASRRAEPTAPTRRDAEPTTRRPGYIGLTAEENPESGIVEVAIVRPGSPAQLAGLRVGDQILNVDGRDLRSLEQLSGTLGQKGPGSRVTFGILRSGRQEQVRVTLASQPTAREERPDVDAEGPSLDRPRNEAGGEARVPGEQQSVLRRLERSLNNSPRPTTRTDVEESPTEPAGERVGRPIGENADRDLRAEVERLERLVESLRLRVEQLEEQLADAPGAGAKPPLPEPKP